MDVHQATGSVINPKGLIMANEISLFGGNTGVAGTPSLSGALFRKHSRDLEQTQATANLRLAQIALGQQVQQAELAAKASLRAAEENAHSYLAATALSNTSALIAQAKSHAKTTPEGAALYEAIVNTYAQGAAQRLNRGFGS